MNKNHAWESFCRIRSFYYEIFDKTTDLLGNFSDQHLLKTLEERENLFELIEKEENSINNINISGCTEIKAEIRDLVTSVITLDKKIAEFVRGRMKEIKTEISGLYSTSRAAVAYTLQRRS
jgi:hypothetical protein